MTKYLGQHSLSLDAKIYSILYVKKFLRLFKLEDVPGKSQTSGRLELKRPLQEFRVSGQSPVRREEKRFQGKEAIFSFLGSDIVGGICRS